MYPDDCVIIINAKDKNKKATCISINNDELRLLPSKAATFPSSCTSSLDVDLCLTGAALLLSCTALVIAFPAYVDELKSNTAAYLLPVIGTSILLAFCVTFTRCGTKSQTYYEHPFCIYSIMLIAMYFGFGYIMVFYSSFQNNLPCIFQNSVRIITVSISTFLYYISNKKVSDLAEMASAFALVFALIASSDFGFSYYRDCEKYKDIHWLIHAFWIIINSLGYHLITCAIHLTEEYVLRDPINNLCEELKILSKHPPSYEKSMLGIHIETQPPTFAARVEQTINDLKKSCFKIAFRLQGVLCLIFSLFWCISVILSMTNIAPYNDSFPGSVLDDAICHIPGVQNPQSVNFNYMSEPYVVSFIRYMRSSNEVRTVSYGSTLKETVINISDNEVLNINVREKRSSVQTNALGFKIIQPTDSILQGHVITTKLKPALVGHVILNKTNINLNGHQITFKQDLFIREHDPLPSKMHRIHRGRGDVRFANDLMNATENPIIQDKAVPKFSNDSTDKVRQKRDAEQNNTNFMINSEYNFENKENQVNGTIEDQEEISMQNVYFSDLFPILDNDDDDDAPDQEEIQFMSLEELEKINEKLTYNTKNNELTKKGTIDDVKKNMSGGSVDNEMFEKSATKEGNFKNTGHVQSKNVSVNGQKKEFEDEALEPSDCGNTAYYGWVVIVAYFAFTISFIRFMILSRASTITMLMMVPALLLSRMWWAFTHGTSDDMINSYLIEIVVPMTTAFTGVPAIIVGVFFLIKIHKLQVEKYNESTTD